MNTIRLEEAREQVFPLVIPYIIGAVSGAIIAIAVGGDGAACAALSDTKK